MVREQCLLIGGKTVSPFSRLSPPHVQRLFQVSIEDESCFFTMKFVVIKRFADGGCIS